MIQTEFTFNKTPDGSLPVRSFKNLLNYSLGQSISFSDTKIFEVDSFSSPLGLGHIVGLLPSGKITKYSFGYGHVPLGTVLELHTECSFDKLVQYATVLLTGEGVVFIDGNI